MKKVYYSLLTVASLLLILGSCSDRSNDNPVSPDQEIKFNLNVTVEPTEAGNVSPTTGEYNSGDSVEVTASAKERWVFEGWQGDHTGTANPVTITMNSDKDIVALFTERTYPLTVNTEGEGTVSERVVQAKTTDYPEGTIVEIIANPAEGWRFSHWEGDTNTEENPIEIVINDSIEVTAVFERRDYPLTIAIEGQGTVSEEIVQTKSTDYPFGTVVELTANAAEGWVFSHWKGDLDSEENPITVEVDTEKNVTAVFKEAYYKVSFTVNGEGEIGEVLKDGDYSEGLYKHGSSVELDAVASNGWQFKSWSGDVESEVNPLVVEVISDTDIIAEFTRNEYSIEIIVEGEGAVTEFLINGNQTDNGYLFESEVRLIANAAAGWKFIEWTGDLKSTDNPITLEVNSNKLINAIFRPESDVLYVMGSNQGGKLGDGTTIDKHEPVMITSNVADISGGYMASFFVKNDGTLMAMGVNATGELGYREPGYFWRNPVVVTNDVKKAVIGQTHSMFIKHDGSLWAMGENSFGQLGDGTATNRTTPVKIAENVVDVSVGYRHTLFLKEDGTLWGMGRNELGELGDGTTNNRIIPVNIALNVKAISAGWRHSFYITTSGRLYGMGLNIDGQLGAGYVSVQTPSPVNVMSNVELVSAGTDHSLILSRDGILYSTGRNEYGQLGDGTTNNTIEPVAVANNVTDISAGKSHSLYITSDRNLWGMGLNDKGQLGVGGTSNHINPIEIDEGVIKISAGDSHSLFIKE